MQAATEPALNHQPLRTCGEDANPNIILTYVNRVKSINLIKFKI